MNLFTFAAQHWVIGGTLTSLVWFFAAKQYVRQEHSGIATSWLCIAVCVILAMAGWAVREEELIGLLATLAVLLVELWELKRIWHSQGMKKLELLAFTLGMFAVSLLVSLELALLPLPPVLDIADKINKKLPYDYYIGALNVSILIYLPFVFAAGWLVRRSKFRDGIYTGCVFFGLAILMLAVAIVLAVDDVSSFGRLNFMMGPMLPFFAFGTTMTTLGVCQLLRIHKR